jgi:hypothetical protein
MDDQPVFVPTEIENDPVVAHEIDGVAELPFDLVWVRPARPGRNCEPGADWTFGLRVTRPEFFQSPARDHLHEVLYRVTNLGTRYPETV